jgi:hypothetical protein
MLPIEKGELFMNRPVKAVVTVLLCAALGACRTFSIKENESIDRSFPVEGGIAERGTLGIARQSWTNWLPFAKKDPFPKADIGVLGRLQESKNIIQGLWYKIKSKNEGELDTLLISAYKWNYQWIGSVNIHNEPSEINLRFEGYSSDEEGNHMMFVLPDAKNPDPDRIELNRLLDDLEILTMPYRLGSFYIGGVCYPLYITQEADYALISDNMPEEELRERKDEFLKGYRSLISLIFRHDQKFQVVNGANLGVADIQGDAYALCDTLPEPDRAAMRHLIAQFYTFIRLTRQIQPETDTSRETSLR